MKICRILGLIGSACCLVLFVSFVSDDGIPNKPYEWFASVSLLLVAFNFFPLPKINLPINNDGLLGLWTIH
jgi:hypothetical protein